MEDRPFGARFIEEARRLTRSTLGFEYAELQRLARMDRSEFMATLGRHLPPVDASRPGSDPTREPEDLARALVERGEPGDPLTIVVNILGGLV